MSKNYSVGLVGNVVPNLLEKSVSETIPTHGSLNIRIVQDKVTIEHLATHPSVDDIRILRITCDYDGTARNQERYQFMVTVEEQVLWHFPLPAAVVVLKPTVENQTIVEIYTMAQSDG